MVLMIKFSARRVLVSVVYLFIAFAVIVWVFPGTAIWLPSNSSELASWVQALGSIGAIFGAFWIATFTSKIENERQNQIYLVDAQVAAIGVASSLKSTADFLTSAKKRLPDDNESFNPKFANYMVNQQASWEFPDEAFVKVYSKVDAQGASSLSIAIESRRQIMGHLNHMKLFGGPADESSRRAMSALMNSMEFHARFSSDSINDFLRIRGVPLDA